MKNVTTQAYRCSRCATVKLVTEFYSDRTKASGHMSACKDCDRNRDRQRYHVRKPEARSYEQRGLDPALPPGTQFDVRAATTTARGLGWPHQKQRVKLLNQHVDGTPCFWCGQSMWKDAASNWDEAPLEAEHSTPRSAPEATLADRLMHRWCNRNRGNGDHDHRRPAITGELISRPFRAHPATSDPHFY